MARNFKDIVENKEGQLYDYLKEVTKIEELEEKMSVLSDAELQAKTIEFKDRLEKGETLEDIKVEAFAVCREGARRVLGLFPYRVQVLGGLVLHDGNIPEMKTGEGKTLTATMPVYLNALSGKGVHVVTVNEYLSERDATEMGELYNFLGLTVGINKSNISKEDKKMAYNSDITYSTNSELGFDYLKDNMVRDIKDKVQQKGLNYALVDEIDSILIDEARTPLIIASESKDGIKMYRLVDRFVKQLSKEDYKVDIETKTINLTDSGMDKAETMFHTDNLYGEGNEHLVHSIANSLQANYVMEKDVDYVVKDGEVLIVDQFTGRTMEGRRYNDGLHQAIESKEGVTIQPETLTSATITYQNYFRLYNKLCGMTGTALTEAEEFMEIYNMVVLPLPTNKPLARKDYNDLIYPTKQDKYKAILKDIKERHSKGQPILVGTVAVETSELLSNMLTEDGIPHEVLNAKNHGREAEIIMRAGQKGAVTIATNMAGRGTDIKLGLGVEDLGGLCVIGTERHESRRIDNQLRGRAGRQGDVGESQFYLSLEDDLMKRFGSDRAKKMLELFTKNDIFEEEVEPMQGKLIHKQVESAQKRVEGNNYDSRKTVLQYDDVKNSHRKIMYEQRDELLQEDLDIDKVILPMIKRVSKLMAEDVFSSGKLDKEKLKKFVEESITYNISNDDTEEKDDYTELIKSETVEELQLKIESSILYEYKIKNKLLGSKDNINKFYKAVILDTIDYLWVEHIDTLDKLEVSVKLRQYAQTDPLVEYHKEGFRLYQNLLEDIDYLTVRNIVKMNRSVVAVN